MNWIRDLHRNWRLRLELALWRYGWAWLVVIGVTVAALAVPLILLSRAQQELVQVQEEAVRLRLGGHQSQTQQVRDDPAVQDALMIAALDRVALSESQVNGVLRRLNEISRSQGLVVAETEFQGGSEGHGGLRRLQLTFPLRAGYPQVRRFVEAVLREFPSVSVDQLLLKRDSARQRQAEMRLRMSIWINPAKPLRQEGG